MLSVLGPPQIGQCCFLNTFVLCNCGGWDPADGEALLGQYSSKCTTHWNVIDVYVKLEAVLLAAKNLPVFSLNHNYNMYLFCTWRLKWYLGWTSILNFKWFSVEYTGNFYLWCLKMGTKLFLYVIAGEPFLTCLKTSLAEHFHLWIMRICTPGQITVC